MAQVMATAREYYFQQCKNWADKITETEVGATEVILDFLYQVQWDFRREYPVKNTGKYIDFLVKAPYEDGYIFFGIECKKQLSFKTKATELADYVEQAGAYARELQVPVFLGPLVDNFNRSQLYQGGLSISPIAATNIFGGRFNVGIMGFSYRYGKEIALHNALFALRGSMFWAEEGFNPNRVNIVTTIGSKKTRTPLRIYKQK